MSQPHTRKTFIAKALGALAVTGLIAPRLLGSSKPADASAAGPESTPVAKAPFTVQADPRSVARTGDVV